MKIANRKSRVMALLLVVCMFMQLFASMGVYAAKDPDAQRPDDGVTKTLHSLDEMADLMVSTTYKEYLEINKSAKSAPKETVVRVNAVDYDKEGTTAVIGEPVFDEELNMDTIVTPDEGKVAFKVEVPVTGMYNLAVMYRPLNEKDEAGNPLDGGSNIERILLIDGEVPYKESRYLSFYRIWSDDKNVKLNDLGRPFKMDINGNEMRPSKFETPEWVNYVVYDTETFFEDPLMFYLEEGTHTIALDAACERMQLAWIELVSPEDNKVKTYEEYEAEHKDKEAPKLSQDELSALKLQAELPYQTSEQVVYAMNDRTSAMTYPQSSSASLLNTIGGNGGDKWKTSGQWISYEVYIPKSGMYEIVTRHKQTVNQGLYSSRAIKINGEYPFDEARSLQFAYDSDWQVDTLNDGTTHFKFYFEGGKTYKIELKAVLGDMNEILNTIDGSQTRLNDYYRQILMITGSEPDEYTDYEFAKLIPDVLRGMRDEAEVLKKVSSDLEKKIGTKGQNTVILDRIAFLLEQMGNNQDKIATNLANYKSYIGSLGTWLLSTKSQPLQLDYIQIQPAGTELPDADTGFFGSLGFELKSFFMSFFTDYNSLGSTKELEEDDPDVVEVWVTTGRDQATIMRQMVDDDFTNGANGTGISVNLKLIAAGTLLPATLAGTGPDVSMDGDPVGFGIRNAVIPLNYFEGFEDVKRGFAADDSPESMKVVEEMFVPLTVLDPDKIEYEDGTKGTCIDEPDKKFKTVNGVERNGVVTYGMPSTLDFSMLFYRKDIFVELGLEVPETWDDVEAIIRALSENRLEMGFGSQVAGQVTTQPMHQIYMYQNDVEWFKSSYDYENVTDRTYSASDRQYMRTVGIQSNLDSNGSLDAFQRMTEWFTLYGQPVSYDFANRFRTGEMPLAIASYTTYNQLKVFAPEIAGLWEFVQLPGVERDDGTINHTAPIAPHAVMMMKDAADDIPDDEDVTKSKKANNAWKYIQWWVSADTQARFGREQVAIMGTAAKYNTANIKALTAQSWTAQEKKNLEQQFKSLKGTPMSPGNYIISRYASFAYYAVINDSEVPSEALLGYVDDINNELTRKRAEYGFLTIDQYEEELKAKAKSKDSDK